jgi:Ferritin-like domain
VNRRSALKLGGATLAATMLRPSLARAKAAEGGLLLGLWRREQGAALAYGLVLHADPILALLRSQETDHWRALATGLAAVGLPTPPPAEEPADLDIAAQRLAESGPDRADVLAAAIALEEDLVAIYKDALPSLPNEKIAMTAATILASHAQHLFILREVT